MRARGIYLLMAIVALATGGWTFVWLLRRACVFRCEMLDAGAVSLLMVPPLVVGLVSFTMITPGLRMSLPAWGRMAACGVGIYLFGMGLDIVSAQTALPGNYAFLGAVIALLIAGYPLSRWAEAGRFSGRGRKCL